MSGYTAYVSVHKDAANCRRLSESSCASALVTRWGQ